MQKQNHKHNQDGIWTNLRLFGINEDLEWEEVAEKVQEDFMYRVNMIEKLCNYNEDPNKFIDGPLAKTPLDMTYILEKAIKFDYISLVECYKTIRAYMAKKYFNQNYDKMHQELLFNSNKIPTKYNDIQEQLPKLIKDEIIDLRNLYSHSYLELITEYDVGLDHIKIYVNVLKDVFIIFTDFMIEQKNI
ncbi:hypothetical protein PDK16_06615 [Bacillus cereus]|nr:hypothetical protein [Bacillus cereus]